MKGLYYLFYIFCFFPFVRILPFGFDSQPNALLFAIIITLLNLHRRVNRYIYILLVVNIIALVLIPYSKSFDVDLLRSIFNYQSLFFITYAIYWSYKKNAIPSYGFFKLVCAIYFIVAFLQITILPDAFMFFLSRSNSTILESGRGVCGLTPEPSYYGSICLLLLIFNYMIYHAEKDFKWVQLCILFQLLFFARSSMAIFILLFSIFVYLGATLFLRKRSACYLFIICCVFIFFGESILQILNDTRIGRLLGKLVESPSLFVLLDQSVNERFVNFFFPIYSMFDNFFLPHSYNSFGDYIYNMAVTSDFKDLFMDFREYRRILSGLGTAFYELGIFSFLIVYVIMRVFFSFKQLKYRNLFCLVFFLLLLNAISSSNALISCLIGSLIYKSSFETVLSRKS